MVSVIFMRLLEKKWFKKRMKYTVSKIAYCLWTPAESAGRMQPCIDRAFAQDQISEIMQALSTESAQNSKISQGPLCSRWPSAALY
jgi:hypothetical protein